MTDNVVRLPTAPLTYYTVEKTDDFWSVLLVEPEQRQAIYWTYSRSDAYHFGRHAAARMMRPFREADPS